MDGPPATEAGNVEGGGDSLPACMEAIGTFECKAPKCYPTFAEVQGGPPVCVAGGDYRETWYDCGGYSLRVLQGVDTSFLSYYDRTSGALVAYISGSNGLSWCQAGPAAGFVTGWVCPAEAPVVDPCAADAGAGD